MSTNGDTRGEANPIDWTKPLRVVGTHRPVERITIESSGKMWAVFDNGVGFEIRPNGAAVCPEQLQRAIENIPLEPRIVERWVEVLRSQAGDDHYMVLSTTLHRERPRMFSDRLARVLIEEPE